MNKRLIIGLTLSAWCLYVASLFLPAVGNDPGWEVLCMCAWPFFWGLVVPFVYLIVNVVFFLSSQQLNLTLFQLRRRRLRPEALLLFCDVSFRLGRVTTFANCGKSAV